VVRVIVDHADGEYTLTKKEETQRRESAAAKAG